MKKLVLVSAATALFTFPVLGMAHGSCDDDKKHCVYWHNSAGEYVKDSSGQCVKTSAWVPGTQIEGCDAIMSKDSDGDGVADDADHCPDTPAGAPVSEVGCPLDSDWDGVPDYKDKCPKTFGAAVDANGCELTEEMVMMEVDLKVNFDSNSARIASDYNGNIEKVADFMKKSEGSTVFIEGHTDSTGSDTYNEKLSLKRAEAVAGTLVYQYGIEENRVNAVGYGESRPVADNATSEGRAMNRRVTAVVKGLVAK